MNLREDWEYKGLPYRYWIDCVAWMYTTHVAINRSKPSEKENQ